MWNNPIGGPPASSDPHARSRGVRLVRSNPPASQGGSTGSIHHIPYTIHTHIRIHRTPQLARGVRSSNKFAIHRSWREWTDRLSSKIATQEQSSKSAVLLHLRTQTICSQSRVYHSTLNDIADRFAPLHSVQSRICLFSP